MLARSRTLIVAAFVLATALAAMYARGIGYDSAVFSYLPDDVPAVKAWRGSLERFDAFDTWLVGLEEPGPGLSIEGLRRVDAVTRSLEGLKASGVLAVRSVTNVQTLREGEGGEVDTGLFMPALPTDAAALNALEARITASAEVRGALVSRDLRGYAIVVRADPRKDGAAVARLVQRTVDAARGPLRARYLGAPFFAAAPIEHLIAALPWIAPLFVLLLVGVFYATTRRLDRVAFVLGGGGAFVVLAMAAMRTLGQRLTPSSGTLLLCVFAFSAALLAGIGDASSDAESRWPPVARVAPCLVVLAVGAFLFARARFLCTPQEMFSPSDEVGQSLAFFDERFGGSDFVQIDFKGDLTDASVAARLLRLSDLLEGTRGLGDVRSVAQILAFVNRGFGDAYRVPSSNAALANLWFFLEGNGDVRNLVSDKRDEAMIQIRVASHPEPPIDVLVGEVNAAIALSARQDPTATTERIQAIARASGVALDPALLAAMTASAVRPPSEADAAAISSEVTTKLRAILASPDSPYAPSAEEWLRLQAALAGSADGLRERLVAVASTIRALHAGGMDAKFVDMLAQREHDLRLLARSERLVGALLSHPQQVPDALRLRLEGAVADLVDPQPAAGSAALTVSGLPVVAPAIAARALSHERWWLAAATCLALLVVPFVGWTAGAQRLLVATTATALTFVVCRALGVDLDSGSATLYVLPPLLGALAPTSRRGTQGFLVALAAALLALLSAGVLPVIRVAVAGGAGLASVALVGWFVRPAARGPGRTPRRSPVDAPDRR